MILDWFKRRQKAASSAYTTVDADGAVLKEIDTVILLRDVEAEKTVGLADVYRGTIPAGTVGTIIIITPAVDAPVDIEFDIGGQLAFAYVAGRELRLHERCKEMAAHA